MKQILLFVLVSFFWLSFGYAKKIDQYENSTLHYFNGVYVLDLRGNREEMMRAHGYFASKHVKTRSPIEFFSNIMDKALTDKFGTLGSRIVGPSLGTFLTQKLSPEDERAFEAFAIGSGVPVEKVLKALYYPDFGEMLASFTYSKNKPLWDMPDLGCSTFVVPKSNEIPGMLFGRNLEFGGVGFFDRYPAVIYLHSTNSIDQSYIQMTALGLPGTQTSYNQSGLMVSLHQLTVNHISLMGDLILNVVDEISRRAKSLEEAKSIIESKKFTTPWKLIVASESQNTGFVAEVSPKGKYFFPLQGAGINETNHVRESSLKSDEFFSSFNYLQSSIRRKYSLSKALSARAVVDAESAINLLGQRIDPITGENTFIGLSKFSNIMSVVVSPKDRELYFGVAHGINTKPSSGDYLRLPLRFDVNFENYLVNTQKPSVAYSESVLQVDRFVRAAMTETNQKDSLSFMVEYIKRAVKTHGRNADLNNVYAALLLKQYAVTDGKSEGYLEEASEVLELGKGIPHNENQKAVNGILSARIALLQNNESLANYIYQGIVPTTLRMRYALENDFKLSKSPKVRAQTLENLKKLKVTLTDLDILDF